jgi:tight adherence protein B
MVEVSALILVVGVAVAFLGLANIMSLDRALVGRLRHYSAGRPVADTASAPRRSGMTGAMAQQFDKAITSRSFAASLQADLARANLKLTAAEFLLGQAAFTFALMLLGYNLVALVSGPNLLAVPVLGLIGFALPKLWVMRRAGARLRAFHDQLPDTITILANALRSGMSLLQAMDMVGREAAPPISEEFARVVREVGLGLSPEDALHHLRRRVESDDVEFLVTATNLQHQVGGNLAQLLDNIAVTIRERVQLKGEIHTLTTQARASGWFLAALPVIAAVLLLLVNPRYMSSLFTMPYLVLPILAGISVLIGFFVIKQIVNSIEV